MSSAARARRRNALAAPAATPAPAGPIFGVVGAIEDEIRLVRARLADRRVANFGSHEYAIGELPDGRGHWHTVAVVASGVGKVNAALAAAGLAQLGVSSAVFTGVAGGLASDLSVGDVIVATDLVQHDVDVTALGRAPGELLGEPLAWHADEALSLDALAAATAVARGSNRIVRRGRIISGDQFIADATRARDLRRSFGAECAEMEGAAFAQACVSLGIHFAVVRVISDTADIGAAVDFPAFLVEAAHFGVEFVQALLDRVPV